MKIRKRHIVYLFLALLDVAIIFLCYRATAWTYFSIKMQGMMQGAVLPLWGPSGQAFVAVYACAIVGCYIAWSVYGSIYLGLIRQMAKRVLIVNTVGIILFILLLYLLHESDVSRVTLGFFYIASTVVVLFKEWLTVQLFYRFRKGRRVCSPVLVIGSGDLAQRYAYAIGTDQSRAEHVVGYIDVGEKTASGNTSSEEPFLRKRMGGIDDLDDILSNNSIESIVIALEADKYECIDIVMHAADKFGTNLTLVPFYNDILPRLPEVDSVRNVSLVNLRSIPLSNPFAAALKRCTDIVVSALIIVLISWLLVIIAVGVKLSSPGPVLFKQKRIGRNNKPFMMPKFRSMRVNDESDTAWSTDDDPRKTKFGSFIRKCSCDELPQFFSVFTGKMSIVGPRPEIPAFVSEFRESIPHYMLRHQVRPGITGWAQVNGLRGNTSIESRIELDIWYIEHWTPWLDVKIFFKTVFGGFVNSERVV